MVYWVAFKIVFSYRQELVEQQITMVHWRKCVLYCNREFTVYRHILYSPEGTVFIV
jgi:hypothetical protein